MLNINNLSVSYPDGNKAVDDISLNLEEGKHLALVGANGAGKTSLLLSVMGILSFEGEIIVDGIRLSKDNIAEVRKRTGFLFQNPDDQLFMPSIYDDIAFGPRNMGIDEETIKYRVDDRLKLLGIEQLKDKTALTLSGGEKRMAALATVLAMKPSLMLLDEPTAFLDPKVRRKLINILKSLPHTMLIATHDLTFAKEVCDESVIIKEGKVFARGKSSELLYDEKLMDEGGIEAIGVER
ncbi:MAG: ABC transporter ATP-binding protein [Lachnospiraceae bacterium]|nr:ABC transporter ATP-binding protein [Lachnospiraceae bacterium]